jgi:hypothetical protein
LISGAKRPEAAYANKDIVLMMLSVCSYLRLCDVPTSDARNAR